MGEGAEAEKGASAMYYEDRNQKVCVRTLQLYNWLLSDYKIEGGGRPGSS